MFGSEVERDGVFRNELIKDQRSQLISKETPPVIRSSNSSVADTAAATDSGDLITRDTLTEILRAGAQKMLKAAIEQEVLDYVNDRTDIGDGNGLMHSPELAIGDGALVLGKALEQVFPATRVQRCTVHKTANVLNKLPKSIQPQAKRMLHDIWKAPTKEEAGKAFHLFEKTFEAKYEKCLQKDRDVLLTFFDFPAENWCHIHTTHPIESTFAAIRLRHRKTKGNGTAKASLTMMFKLAQSAEKGWRKLRGHHHIPDLLRGIKFIDGVNENQLKEEDHRPSQTTTIPTEIVA